jgi:hypothetical protein
MTYIALKPCRFAGQDFRIDDLIQGDLIHPGQVENLVKMGKIAKVNDGAEPASTIAIPAHAFSVSVKVEEGDLVLEPTDEGVQAIFSVLTSEATEAKEIVKAMTDADALILLHVSDSRKTIKAAAEERAKALNAEKDEGEQ